MQLIPRTSLCPSMKNRVRFVFSLIGLFALALSGLAGSRKNGRSDEATYDLLIKNGRIIDGTGNPWYAGDVGVRGDRIVAIGHLRDATAKQVMDARGLVVSPGFIDMLGQSELALLIDNRALSKLSQGIT